MLFSIITINYNNKTGLQKTIDSVLCQTWSEYEWIIIDGGSSDGSKELIESIKDRLSYWCSEPDSGVYNAMNKGLSQANGDYLCFMNSGDVFYEPSTLEQVSNEKLDGDVVYGDAVRLTNEGEESWLFPHKVDYEFFCKDNICHQAMFIKGSILRAEGYDESFKICSDWARWLKLAFEGGVFQYIPIVICKYNMDGMSSKNNGISEYIKVISSIPLPNALKKLLEYRWIDREVINMVRCRPLVKKLVVVDEFLLEILISLYTKKKR